MKTKYDIGETVLVPCKVSRIIINQNQINYRVILNGYDDTTIDLSECEIHSGMCKHEVKEGEVNE